MTRAVFERLQTGGPIQAFVKGERAQLADIEPSMADAIRRANELADSSRMRHSVIPAATPGHWAVWRLIGQWVGHCGQCGCPFRARACGPTHAMIAHEQGIKRDPR